jgi:preprotein translocase subunit SecG
MNIVGILLLVIHVACCTGLILVVLLQAGKGASLGAAFGGGSSQTMFGAAGATLIGKLTWVMAGAFMATSLLLTIIPISGNGGVMPEPAIMQEEPITSPPLGMPALPETGSELGQDPLGVIGGELTPEAPPTPSESAAHPEHELPPIESGAHPEHEPPPSE